MNHATFYHSSGATVQGVSTSQHSVLLSRLRDNFGITPLQNCESASFSMAMVVRYALGLTALGGEVCALVNDTFAGWITLACARHLATSGSRVRIIFLMDPEKHGDELPVLLRPLERMNVNMDHWSCYPDSEAIGSMLSDCHSLLCGLHCSPLDRPALPEDVTIQNQYIDILNEHQIPIHCVQMPLGVDGDTGASTHPLYASSTLSLGLPLNGLYTAAEQAGRHYVCDLSLHQSLVEAGEDIIVPNWLFAEQPVVQISTQQAVSPSASNTGE